MGKGTGLVRFGVAMESSLLERFDASLSAKGYANRSEALRDLIRAHLIEQDIAEDDRMVAGSLTMVYLHHEANVAERLTELQHQFRDWILSSVHVHLDDESCLEVLVLRGPAGRLRALADLIIGSKGVKHGQLLLTVPEP